MPKVKFTETRYVLDENKVIVQTFEAGQEYDLVASSAERWIRRGYAVEVKEEQKKEEPKKEKRAPEKVAEQTKPNEADSSAAGEQLRAVHSGRGRYKVVDAKGAEFSDESISQAEALDFASNKAEQIPVRQEDGGKLYVDVWPKRTTFANGYLDGESDTIKVADGRISINVANGGAVYQIVRRDQDVTHAVLVESRVEQAKADDAQG